MNKGSDDTEYGEDYVLTLDGISKTFGDQKALDGVGLRVRRGSIHALVGENGSGKSTLIKILAGFHTPDPGGCGKVYNEHLPWGSSAAAHRMGLRFVHQSLGLIDELNASDNIGLVAGFASRLGGISTARQRDHARSLLNRLGMRLDLTVPVAELRPVERTAVAIARAVADNFGPIRLLVLDEPTAALPPTEVDMLFELIRGLRATGVSFLYVSHRIDEILALCDEVSTLRDGRPQGTVSAHGQTRDDIVSWILGESEADTTDQTPEAATPRPAPTAVVPRPGDSERQALTVEGLRTETLNGIDFSVAPGEILGVAGLEGSGREDLAAALGGMHPASGTLTDADGSSWGRLTPRAARRHRLALALANWHPDAAVHEFTLRENLTMPRLRSFRRMGLVSRRAETHDTDRWLCRVDIRPRDPHKIYGLLSGGNKQKAIVASCLGTDPKVIVLDDPTSGVDIGARRQIYNLITQEARRGVGVVLCSSDQEDITEVCNRVICLNTGDIVDELSGDEITDTHLLAAIVGRADTTAANAEQRREKAS